MSFVASSCLFWKKLAPHNTFTQLCNVSNRTLHCTNYCALTQASDLKKIPYRQWQKPPATVTVLSLGDTWRYQLSEAVKRWKEGSAKNGGMSQETGKKRKRIATRVFHEIVVHGQWRGGVVRWRKLLHTHKKRKKQFVSDIASHQKGCFDQWGSLVVCTGTFKDAKKRVFVNQSHCICLHRQTGNICIQTAATVPTIG